MTKDNQLQQHIEAQQRSEYVEADNQISLTIYNHLWHAMKTCENHSSQYLNLISVFFHDMMVMLSGIALRTRELHGPYQPFDTSLEQRLHGFPYFDYVDLTNGIDPGTKSYSQTSLLHSAKRRLYSQVSELTGLGRTRVALATPISLNRRKLAIALLSNRFKLSFPDEVTLPIPGLEEQLSTLIKCIKLILIDLNLEHLESTVCAVIRRHILARSREGTASPPNWDILVTGSSLEPYNRLLAAQTLAAGAPVVSIAHGEGYGVFNEPIFGYGERTFSTHLVGYGPTSYASSTPDCYVASLYKAPQYFESDAPGVKRIYKSPSVQPLQGIDGQTIVYVPTSFSAFRRYGPFRDIPDRLYLAWQDALLEQFPGTIWKGHPKDYMQALIPQGASQTSRLPLETFLDIADTFLFDYVSTALFLAMATNKPIVYFDIGLRNITPSALHLIKQRCIYVNVDPTLPSKLRERVLSAMYTEHENLFTAKYSLANESDGDDREMVLLRLINRILA